MKTTTPIFSAIFQELRLLFRNKLFVLFLVVTLMLMAYGTHGNLELLSLICKDWSCPGVDTSGRTPILNWIPWDREFISFVLGFFLLVLVPCAIIKWGFKADLADYGLAWPARDKRKSALVLFLGLTLVSAIGFYTASLDKGMQALYPFYKTFSSPGEFFLYELTYFPFFMVIEFVFRGYLLMGLANTARDANNGPAALAVIIAMIPYCVWHIGKPLTELWTTPIWGLVAGTGVYLVRSVWPVLMAHWLLNIWLDGLILHHLHLAPFN